MVDTNLFRLCEGWFEGPGPENAQKLSYTL